jgi:holliday junction DNA helicase RuvA
LPRPEEGEEVLIASLRGRIARKSTDKVEIAVGGVGFKVLIPLSTYQALPAEHEEVSLFTSMQVKENGIDLIGFASEAEREVFELLISVSGVGVKLALTILSGIRIDDLVNSIMSEDRSLLSSVSGIGPKTAGRVILELKEKVAKVIASAGISAHVRITQVEEAIMALEALGYSRYEAKRAVDTVIKEIGTQQTSETIIREALKAAV